MTISLDQMIAALLRLSDNSAVGGELNPIEARAFQEREKAMTAYRDYVKGEGK